MLTRSRYQLQSGCEYGLIISPECRLIVSSYTFALREQVRLLKYVKLSSYLRHVTQDVLRSVVFVGWFVRSLTLVRVEYISKTVGDMAMNHQ